MKSSSRWEGMGSIVQMEELGLERKVDVTMTFSPSFKKKICESFSSFTATIILSSEQAKMDRRGSGVGIIYVLNGTVCGTP